MNDGLAKLMTFLSILIFAALFGALGYYVVGHEVATRVVNGIPNDREGMAFSMSVLGGVIGWVVAVAVDVYRKNDS